MTQPNGIQSNKRAIPQPKRCAIYARYSSEKQRDSSIEDQIRKCREYADRQAWVVLQDYIRYDEAISGAMFEQRTELQSLIADAERNLAPFDVVLVDSTSRLARFAEDQLSMIKNLKFRGVQVIAVSQGLDSAVASARISFAIHGIMDEQYLEDLANNVRRGQEGCVKNNKYIAGGRCYGYTNVPDEDPTKIGDYGRPFVRGVMRVINRDESPTVERIFQMYDKGSSFDRIAQALRADGVQPPRPPRKNSLRGWSADGIKDILRNPIYIGEYIWKRTTSVRDPKTRRMVARPVPDNEWVRSYRPDWRIISDDLWKRVQARRALRKHIGARKLGGLERTERSRKYLFGGLLYCALCGWSMSIVDTDAEIARYGCGTCRNKKLCSNNRTIRQDSLERQLIHWLTQGLLEGNRLDQAVQAFHKNVRQRVAELQAEARKSVLNAPGIRKQLMDEQEEARNITDYIAKAGARAPISLLDELAKRDSKIKELGELLARAKHSEPLIGFTADEIRVFLEGRLTDLKRAVTSSPEAGKQILQKHIRKIILTPGEREGKRVFHVAIEFELGGSEGNSGVLLNDTLDAISQQYGFSTITVAGLTLDTSRVRRKPVSIPPQIPEDDSPAPAAVNSTAETPALLRVSIAG